MSQLNVGAASVTSVAATGAVTVTLPHLQMQ